MVRVYDFNLQRFVDQGKGRRARINGGKYEGQIDIAYRLIMEHGELTTVEVCRLMKPAPWPSIRRCLSMLKKRAYIRKKDDKWVISRSWYGEKF